MDRSKIDIWVVEERLGGGGMGTVYRCHNQHARRIRAAIKVLEQRAATSGELRQRFVREAELLFELDHPHIVKVRNIRMESDPPFIEMAFVEGASLADHLSVGPLAAGAAARVVGQIASALHHCHERGVAHRDVKPANILLGGQQATLVDFGIAAEAGGTLAGAGGTVGTLPYTPPEWGRSDTDPRLWDAYSLGIVLYESLLGRMAFPPKSGASIREEMFRQLDLKRETECLDPGNGYPEPLRGLVRRLTARSPADRMGSLDEVAWMLAQFTANRDDLDLPTLNEGGAARVDGGRSASVGGSTSGARTSGGFQPRSVRSAGFDGPPSAETLAPDSFDAEMMESGHQPGNTPTWSMSETVEPDSETLEQWSAPEASSGAASDASTQPRSAGVAVSEPGAPTAGRPQTLVPASDTFLLDTDDLAPPDDTAVVDPPFAGQHPVSSGPSRMFAVPIILAAMVAVAILLQQLAPTGASPVPAEAVAVAPAGSPGSDVRPESGDETRPDPVRRAEATDASVVLPTVGCVGDDCGAEPEAAAVLPTSQQPAGGDGEPEPARPSASRPPAPSASASTAGGTGHLLTAGELSEWLKNNPKYQPEQYRQNPDPGDAKPFPGERYLRGWTGAEPHAAVEQQPYLLSVTPHVAAQACARRGGLFKGCAGGNVGRQANEYRRISTTVGVCGEGGLPVPTTPGWQVLDFVAVRCAR